MNEAARKPYTQLLLDAPSFADSTGGRRQSRAWKNIVDDIHSSTSLAAFNESRARAEGYIRALVDSDQLSTRDTERDYVILSTLHKRHEYLARLASEYGY